MKFINSCFIILILGVAYSSTDYAYCFDGVDGLRPIGATVTHGNKQNMIGFYSDYTDKTTQVHWVNIENRDKPSNYAHIGVLEGLVVQNILSNVHISDRFSLAVTQNGAKLFLNFVTEDIQYTESLVLADNLEKTVSYVGIRTAEIAGQNYIFVNGGVEAGIIIVKINSLWNKSIVKQFIPTYGNSDLGFAEVDGKTYLVTGNFYGNGNKGTCLFDVTDISAIKEIYCSSDFNQRGMTVSEVNGQNYLFQLDTGLFEYPNTCSQTICAFQINENGIDTTEADVVLMDQLSGQVIGNSHIKVHSYGGKSYLLSGDVNTSPNLLVDITKVEEYKELTVSFPSLSYWSRDSGYIDENGLNIVGINYDNCVQISTISV